MASKKSVKLYYDVVSPYSWLAFEVLTRYKTKWDINLILKPFFLGGIMQSSGNSPPMMIPNKGKYMYNDLRRLRQHYNVPITAPKNPFEVMVTKGSLAAMRFLTAIQSISPENTENVSRQLWMRIWGRDEDITKPESFLEACRHAGIDEAIGKEAVKKMKEDSIKSKLKETTQEAIDFDAFGAPTIITTVNNEEQMIFGSDRFPILADLLGEKYEGPLAELSKAKL